MTNNVFKKSLVIGIIILFLGASIIPFVTSKETLKTSTFNSTGFTDNCDWIVDNEGDGDFTNIRMLLISLYLVKQFVFIVELILKI